MKTTPDHVKMTLYHVTTPKKVKEYRDSGRINPPVRGFTTLMGAMAWAIGVGRSVILQVEGTECYKLPDHHNKWGEAWWIDHDVEEWECVFSTKESRFYNTGDE